MTVSPVSLSLQKTATTELLSDVGTFLTSTFLMALVIGVLLGLLRNILWWGFWPLRIDSSSLFH
jgi:hypothetical protein